MQELSKDEQRIIDELFVAPKNIYMIGIGGCGMSSLGKILIHLGHHLSGSDTQMSPYLDTLLQKKVNIILNPKQTPFDEYDMVIYTSAIKETHMEFLAARKAQIPIFHRAQILSALLNRNTSIAVTGTHGKTTTSALASFLLNRLGANPTCMVGGKMLNGGDNVLLGNKDLYVAEVDESDGTHALYEPSHSIITNLEEEHMDHYESLDHLKETFKDFVLKTREGGHVIYSNDDVNLRGLMRSLDTPAVSYGLSKDSDFYAENIVCRKFNSQFNLFYQKQLLTRIHLSIPGRHNILNSMAVLGLLHLLGYDMQQMKTAITEFKGTGRRLELKYDSPEMIIVDDYAHHPTEIQATLDALKGFGRKICVVFQPHRYSRTKHFAEKFGASFDLAEKVILTDVYSAGEIRKNSKDGVRLIYDALKSQEHPDVLVLEREKILNFLEKESEKYGLIVFLGAGDIGELADDFTRTFAD